jgi:hypothetical protein
METDTVTATKGYLAVEWRSPGVGCGLQPGGIAAIVLRAMRSDQIEDDDPGRRLGIHVVDCRAAA